MNEHLSRRTLERLSVDDLGAVERAAAEQHAGACGACREVLRSLGEAREAYHGAVSASDFARAVDARIARASKVSPLRRPAWTAAVVLAAAACLVVFVRPPHDDVRYKGSAVGLFVRRSGDVRAYSDADRLEVGDQLQVTVTSPRGGRVAAWMVDVDDRVDALTPGGPIALGAGEHALPSSAIVEAPCRDLWLVVDRRPNGAHEDDEVRRIRKSPPDGVLVRSLRCR
jgi:hypothetical protein